MENNILKKYAKKGFFLDKDVLKILSELKDEDNDKIINILVGMNIKERIITKKLFEKYEFSKFLFNKTNKEEIKSVKILSPLTFPSKKIEVSDFINLFRDRYKSIKEILEKENLINLSSIRKIGNKNSFWTIIAMVSDKRVTKNKNLLVEIEDLTGKSVVLINKENKELFNSAKNLLLDDIVAFKVSGSNKMLFANEIIYPDIGLKEEKYGEVDSYVAFSGDFHVGSKMFLEKNLLRFISWLNGEIGDERQRSIAKKVKYLFLVGDNIDGVSHYPGQEKFLNIKTCSGQYSKVEEILKKIRSDINIIMCSGQHDAVWVGEPQLIIPEKWAKGLHDMKNLYIVPNPSFIEIEEGFKILMYHGASINGFINEMSEIRVEFGHMHPTRVVKEMLKRRHLSPVYGLMDNVPYKGEDSLVIRNVPDIIVTADQHRAEINNYNNILMISSSCWQSITPFEEKVGNIPDPCKVPIFNLKTRKIKIMDFGDCDEACFSDEKLNIENRKDEK